MFNFRDTPAVERGPGRFPSHREFRCRARTQKFAISKNSNFRCHTRFFIYQLIFLKLLGFLINILHRLWFDFKHDQTFTFEVIKVFIFSRILIFTREYLTKVANSHLRTPSWVYLPCVKISSKSVQPFPRYRADKFRYVRTDVRTYVQTDGRHRKLIVDYPQATFNSTKVIWSKSVQPFPRYRVVARGCPWLHVRP